MGAIDIVSASAGSGKTYNMAYRYIRTLIENPTDYRHILAVTFTNKATDELKERILNQLHSLAQGTNEDFENKLTADTGLDRPTVRRHAAEARSNILHDYNNFSVMTIDKFFQRVMRAFIKELDVNINFNLELKTESLISQAADLMLDRLSESEQEELRSWVMYYVGESIEDGEGWNIKKSLVQLGKELFKEEFRDVQISPKDKPVLFKIVTEAQQRASVAMKEYQRGAKHFVRLMDDNALLVSDFFQGSRGPAGQAQKAASGQLVKLNSYSLGVLDGAPLYGSKCSRKATIDAIAPQLLEALDAMRQAYPRANISLNTANTLARLYREFALLADLREALNKICDTEGILPISDVGELIRKLISGNEAPFIYEKSGNRYTHFMIDEFQDINRTQYDIVRLLAGEKQNLFIVGDDDQSIYRFRGAKPDIMLGFEKQYPQAVKIVLEENYRSTQAIVETAGRVIGGNKKRFLKKLHTGNKAGEPVEIRAFPNSGMQNKELAKKLREYQERGIDYSDMAVLFRTNSDARLLVEYLMEYNIPFRLKEALPDIYDHWISKDIITYIRIAMGSRARADFLKIINRPKRYISRECLDTTEFSFDRLISFYEEKRWMVERIERLEEDINFMQDMPPYAAISYVRKAIGYEDFLKEYAQNKRINPEELFLVLDELQESAEGFQTAEEWFAHIEEYREEIKQQEKQLQEENQDAVVLSTLHGSKGLEYSVVFLTDVNEGVLPYKKAALDEDIEEERRMLYVGMTRAKERLHVYYVKERYHKQMEPSRFLVEAGLIPVQEEK